MTRKSNTGFRWCAGTLTVLLLGLLLAGCFTAQEKRLEKGHLNLVYRDNFSAGPDIRDLRLQHPIDITREEVQDHLFSLRYQELSLLGKRRYVFSKDSVHEITPLLTKALNRMRPDKILYYEVDTPRGTTAGSVFRAGGQIHWRFDSIKGARFSGQYSAFPGWRDSNWRLVPKDGQRYGQSKGVFGKSIQENWIIASFHLPVKSERKLRKRSSLAPSPKHPATRALKNSQPKLSSPSDSEELEKRLQFLKDLRNKNLIDDQEYKRKRKELLDQHI
jgi:hypothetical protein